jgi:tetratricopeptide (TPR) repeat protein
MRARRIWFAVLLGLGCLGTRWALLSAQESGKPPAGRAPGWLTPEEVRRARQLEDQVRELTEAGQLDQARKAAETLAELFKKELGASHWRSADARWGAEALRRVLKRDAVSQKKFARLGGLQRAAAALEARGRYREAKPLREEVLTTRRDLLGDEHPDTAVGYNNLAANLNAMGRYAEAEEHLRKALSLRRKLLGEENPGTALGYNNLAVNLSYQKRFAEAEDAYRKALALFHRLLGDTHPLTANTYDSLAHVQAEQGRFREAEKNYRTVLTLYRRLRGEEDLKTVHAYHNLALTLHHQGIYGEAEVCCRKALALRRQVLGEEAPDTAESYRLLGAILNRQHRYAEAEESCARGLALSRKLLGEEHLDTAGGYDIWADNLGGQGRYPEAEEAYRKALALRRKLRGEENNETANSYINLAVILFYQRQYAEAETLLRRAVGVYDKLQGKVGAEDAPTRKSLLYGAATAYNNLATSLTEQGRHAEAEKYCRKALTARARLLGEEHPTTVYSYNTLALSLYGQGRYAEAEEAFRKAAAAYRSARLHVSASGLARAAYGSRASPLPFLAALLARNGKPDDAWQCLEQGLARGTGDELQAYRHRSSGERARRAAIVRRIDRLDALLKKTALVEGAPDALKKQQAAQRAERRQAQDELDAVYRLPEGQLERVLDQVLSMVELGEGGVVMARGRELTAQEERLEQIEHADKLRELQRVYGPARSDAFDRAAVQAALPAHTALIAWVDLSPAVPGSADPEGEHWAALLRASGPPAWVRLKGSGEDGAWTQDDYLLPDALRAALRSPKGAWRPLAERLRRQRLDPLRKHLAAKDGQPAVRRLVVLPSQSWLAGVPVEALTDNLTVSYALSGTLYAQQRKQPPAGNGGLLALADPVFERSADADKKARPVPPGGVLLTVVMPGSRAAAAGLRAGDVLLRYGGAELASGDDLAKQMEASAKGPQVTLTIWRDGKTSRRTAKPGKLGVVVANDPAPAALDAWRKTDPRPVPRGGEEDWAPLPGTRAEVEALRRLFTGTKPAPTLLTGSDASEQKLDELARSEALGNFGYIHLATHGIADDHFPLRSAVVLARGPRAGSDKQLETGPPRYDGYLTARKVLRTWELRADLVTLSACQTALGKQELGEGSIGFAQALLIAGSRSVCLSLWKVDDTATALLMERFYQNLLGRRDGLKEPMQKAAALAEAKAWLRALPRDEALKRVSLLTKGMVRGKGRPLQPLLPDVPAQPGRDTPPYAHPYYWAAFILVGNTD